MSINSSAQFGIKQTLPPENKPSAYTRLGVQGELPMTGLKGLGSMGINKGVPHHLSTSYSRPSPMQSLTLNNSTLPARSSGMGMRGGALGGGFGGNFGGGGADGGKIL